MKKKFAILAILAMLGAFSIEAYGYSNALSIFFSIKSTVPCELVIIAGRHDNANMYTESMLLQAGIDELIVRSIAASHDNVATAHVSIIVPDSLPELITEVAVTNADASLTDSSTDTVENQIDNLFVQEGISSANEDVFKEAMTKDILDYLLSDALRADDEEVDLLAAISEAQKFLEGYPDSERYIIILDTGITTSGFLDMRRTDIMDGTVEDVISSIEEGAFADLTGIYVGFWNLGNVSGDQARLSNTVYEQRLAELWTEIIVDECNGTLLQESLACSASVGEAMSDDDGYPLVSPVYFNGEEESSEKDIVTLETFTLHFKAESSEFTDEEEEKLLASHIDEILLYLQENPDQCLYLVGSIALTSEDAEKIRSSVSAARAQAVADILTEDYGIRQNRIIVIDAGTTAFSWRGANVYSDNASDSYTEQEEMAAARVVAVIAENSEDVDELRQYGYVE